MKIKILEIKREVVGKSPFIFFQMSKQSLKPVDLITEKSTKERAVELITKLVAVSSLGILLYKSKSLIINMFKK